MASDTGRMSLAVPTNKQKKLESIAKASDRSRNWIINQAIDQYLDLYDWQTQKIEDRLAQANEKNAIFHSSSYVDQHIEKFKI